jgi:hypothetical protein
MTTATPQDQIIQLMQVSSDQRNKEWIKDSLQAAIALELATIPPYLCGLWSIKKNESDGKVKELIRGIVLDEMFHMGLVCNMLSAIGGTPRIVDTAPKYPTSLPGHVHKELTVYLAGLTKDYVKDVFMEIELPEHPVASYEDSYPTIGAFYDAILKAFQKVHPDIKKGNQLSRGIGTNSLEPIKNLDDVKKFIEVIKEQGEGTSSSPKDEEAKFAHYYKFGEIYYEKELEQVNGEWKFTGGEVKFPGVHPMGEVPDSGWPDPKSPEVLDLLNKFNGNYTALLQDLDKAWANQDEGALGKSIETMGSLGDTAVALMQIPLPDDPSHTYGPEFRVMSYLISAS